MTRLGLAVYLALAFLIALVSAKVQHYVKSREDPRCGKSRGFSEAT